MSKCEHKFKEIILKSEYWKPVFTGWYTEVVKDIIREFYLYCEKCGKIIENKNK